MTPDFEHVRLNGCDAPSLPVAKNRDEIDKLCVFVAFIFTLFETRTGQKDQCDRTQMLFVMHSSEDENLDIGDSLPPYASEAKMLDFVGIYD